MAGQRFEIAARLLRGAVLPISIATIVALPMVAAQTAGNGGQRPAAGAYGGGRGLGSRGGARGNYRRGGRGRNARGPAYGQVPGTGVPAVTIQGGGPTGPVVAAPSTFRIATPADGATVRGIVAVQVPAGRMEDGSYVSFSINDPLSSASGEGLQFATIRNDNSGTFVWNWDTRAVGTDGNPIFPDKNYTIYVVAHDPLGREMTNGEAQITVSVNNFLPRSTGPVRLSYHLAVGDQQNYLANYSLSPHLPGDEASAPRITGSAQWDVSVDDIDRTAGIASLSALFNDVTAEDLTVVRNGRLTANWNATLFEGLFGQRTASFDLTPDGELTPIGRPGPYDWARVGLAGNIYIPLRDTPVGVGDRWDGPMMIWTLGNHAHRTRVGDTTNTLVAFEWMDGVKTAKIRTDYQVDLPPPGQQAAAAAGPQLGGMSSSFTPGGGYPGMGGGGGLAPVMATGTLKGERYTWFDFQHGRVVRVIDTRTITNLPALFGASGGGTGGAPGMGGGYPGMGGMPGMGGSAGAGSTASDLSWLPGFQYSAAAAQAAMAAPSAGGMPGMGGGYPGMGGMPGGMPGMGGSYPGMGGMPGGMPGMGGGYPGMGGMPGGMPGMGGGYPGMGGMGGGYPGMGGMGGGYPGMGGMGGGYPGMGGMGGGYPGMGGMGGGYPGMGGMGGGYPGMGGGMSGGMPGSNRFNNTNGGMGAGSTFQAPEPPTYDETIDTSLVTGGGQYL